MEMDAVVGAIFAVAELEVASLVRGLVKVEFNRYSGTQWCRIPYAELAEEVKRRFPRVELDFSKTLVLAVHVAHTNWALVDEGFIDSDDVTVYNDELRIRTTVIEGSESTTGDCLVMWASRRAERRFNKEWGMHIPERIEVPSSLLSVARLASCSSAARQLSGDLYAKIKDYALRAQIHNANVERALKLRVSFWDICNDTTFVASQAFSIARQLLVPAIKCDVVVRAEYRIHSAFLLSEEMTDYKTVRLDPNGPALVLDFGTKTILPMNTGTDLLTPRFLTIIDNGC